MAIAPQRAEPTHAGARHTSKPFPPSFVLRAHRAGVSTVSFAKELFSSIVNERWICSGDVSGEVKIWDLAVRRSVLSFSPAEVLAALGNGHPKNAVQQQLGVLMAQFFSFPSAANTFPGGLLVVQTRNQHFLIWRVRRKSEVDAGALDGGASEDTDSSSVDSEAGVEGSTSAGQGMDIALVFSVPVQQYGFCQAALFPWRRRWHTAVVPAGHQCLFNRRLCRQEVRSAGLGCSAEERRNAFLQMWSGNGGWTGSGRMGRDWRQR